MKTIVIKTQEELDKLPDKFDDYAVIEIRSSGLIIVEKTSGNSRIEAWDNSRVKACGNSHVEAWDNSHVEAWGNSHVEAWDNSSVVARGKSRVEACDNSRVKACDNSSVEAWGNSHVVAWDNSRVVARGKSRVEAWGNSHVEACDNSSVVACDNSSVELFISAYVIVLSSRVVVNKLLDYATAVFRGCEVNVQHKSDTAMVRQIPGDIIVPFEEWLARGYVVADGVHRKLKSQKKLGEIEVFECEEFLERESSYVVKRGDAFSHGETVEKAIEDLRYKISDRDTSKYESWRGDLDREISLDEAISAYRVITGACEFGVKDFVRSIEVPDKLSIREVFRLTDGRFGAEKFREFFCEEK
jgi:hypothetical protein